MCPARAEPDLWVGVAGDVEQPRITELPLVTVGGVGPHGDLVTGLHLGAAQFEVLGQIAAHEDDRGSPPDDLLDGGGGHAVEVRPPLLPLLRIAGERHHAVADRIARRLVAGGRQQDEERANLRRRQVLAVDLGLNQVCGEVLTGPRPPFLGQVHAVLREFDDCLDHHVEITGRLVVSGSQNHRRPVEDLLFVLLRDAHHVADDLQRQRTGYLVDEVGVRVAMVGGHVRHEPARAVVHTVLDASHDLGREGTVDHLAQPKVTRVVKADHRAHELRDLSGHVVERRARRDRAEDLGVTAGMVDVVERRERPMPGTPSEAGELGDLEEGDRRFAPQRRERAVTPVVVPFPELDCSEVDVGEWDIGRRGAVLATRDTGRVHCHRHN